MKCTDSSSNFIQVIDPNKPESEPVEIINEYDKDNVHYTEYSDGSVLSSTNTLPHETEWIDAEKIQWKSKKDFINKMNWFNKILYYLWIIVLYKSIPVRCFGDKINDKPFLQTYQGTTYSTYWHWNYWNPLTYVVLALFVLFMCVATIFISVIKILKMSNLITIKIDNA